MVVDGDVTRACVNCLNEGIHLKRLNHTTIVLVLKGKEPRVVIDRVEHTLGRSCTKLSSPHGFEI